MVTGKTPIVGFAADGTRGVWEKLLEILIDDQNYKWLMIDASHIKVHSHAAGARGGNQDVGRTKKEGNSKIDLAVDAHGMPVRSWSRQVPRRIVAMLQPYIEGIDTQDEQRLRL